jgi:hypothetical protein
MNSKILRLLALGSMVAGPMTANAQTETLDYIGSPFTSRNIDGNLTNGLANAIAENAGELVLSSPLGDNLNNAAVTPLSWSFDSNTQFGSIYLNSHNPAAGDPGDSMSFKFSTDANGAITGWSIAVIGGIFEGTNTPSFADITIGNAGDTFSTGFSSPSCAAPPPTPCYTVTESNAVSGSWNTTIAQAPEMDSTSAAGALTLLLGCIAVLRGRRARSDLRRSDKRQSDTFASGLL